MEMNRNLSCILGLGALALIVFEETLKAFADMSQLRLSFMSKESKYPLLIAVSCRNNSTHKKWIYYSNRICRISHHTIYNKSKNDFFSVFSDNDPSVALLDFLSFFFYVFSFSASLLAHWRLSAPLLCCSPEYRERQNVTQQRDVLNINYWGVIILNFYNTQFNIIHHWMKT